MDDWDALQTICLYVIYGTIIVAFGAALGLIVGWMLWGEKR